MRLLIDKKDLELLLEKKREFIGNKVAIDTIIAGVSFLLSVFTASYDDILGIPGMNLCMRPSPGPAGSSFPASPMTTLRRTRHRLTRRPSS